MVLQLHCPRSWYCTEYDTALTMILHWPWYCSDNGTAFDHNIAVILNSVNHYTALGHDAAVILHWTWYCIDHDTGLTMVLYWIIILQWSWTQHIMILHWPWYCIGLNHDTAVMLNSDNHYTALDHDTAVMLSSVDHDTALNHDTVQDWIMILQWCWTQWTIILHWIMILYRTESWYCSDAELSWPWYCTDYDTVQEWIMILQWCWTQLTIILHWIMILQWI